MFSCLNLEREIQEEVRSPEILICAVALAGSATPEACFGIQPPKLRRQQLFHGGLPIDPY
jgi:hypothetical protein